MAQTKTNAVKCTRLTKLLTSQPTQVHTSTSEPSTLDVSWSHLCKEGSEMEGKETIKEGSRRKGRRQQSEVLYRVLYPNTHENGIKN